MEDRTKDGVAEPAYSTLAQNQLARGMHQQSDTMAADNRVFLAQLEAIEHENYEITEYLRQELESRDEDIAELHARIEEMEAESSAARQKSAAEEEKLRQAHASSTAGLHEEVGSLRSQLATLSDAMAKRIAADDELVKLRTLVRKLESDLTTQASSAAEADMRVLEAAKRARAEAEQRAEEARGWDADGAGLDARGRRLLQENHSMAAELQLHISESEALQKDVKVLQAESGQLRRDLELKCEMEVQYAQRGVLQAKRLAEERARAASLEVSLARVLQDFQRERDMQQATHAAERTAAQADIGALRRLAKARGRALHKVRSLAQDVLRGRSEIEIFLVTSLRMVREQIGRNRQPLALTNGGDAGLDLQLGEDILTERQVDVKDLSWEDREKVLRMLFAKMNHRRQKEKQQAELPPPSFDSEDDEVDNAAPLRGLANHAGPASLV